MCVRLPLDADQRCSRRRQRVTERKPPSPQVARKCPMQSAQRQAQLDLRQRRLLRSCPVQAMAMALRRSTGAISCRRRRSSRSSTPRRSRCSPFHQTAQRRVSLLQRPRPHGPVVATADCLHTRMGNGANGAQFCSIGCLLQPFVRFYVVCEQLDPLKTSVLRLLLNRCSSLYGRRQCLPLQSWQGTS